MSISSAFPAGQRWDVHRKLSGVHLKDRPPFPAHSWLEVNTPARSPPNIFVLMTGATKGRDPLHMYANVWGWRCIFSRCSPTPPSHTAPIKACVISELAAMKSQPRAHLFKRKNNEFFVASHLPVTINLGFLQVYVRRSVQQGLSCRC